MNIPGKLRPLTTYIAGNPGSGKSSLMQQMALYDIRKGRGVCTIDPAGGLSDRLLHWIPKSRVKDTIYFDTDFPVPINFFSYNKDNPGERQVLVDQLIAIFQLDNAPVAKPRLGDILAALFDANEKIPNSKDHYTFLDIFRFIQEKDFREKVFQVCPEREGDWIDGFPTSKDMSPVTDRLRPFRTTPALKTMFSSTTGITISDVMKNNQIFLINVKDTPTDYFIASLICSKFQQATFARRKIKLESARVPYYLYVDECHQVLSYAVKEFEAILTRARKYKLCLTLANQIPSDLPTDIQRKLGTIGNLLLFNLEYKDAKVFEHIIKPFEPEHLLGLESFHAIARTGKKVRAIKTPTFLGFSPASYAETIKKRTLEKYGCQVPNVVVDSK